MTISDVAAVSDHNRFWLQWMLWGLLMSLVMGWVARSRGRPGHVGSHPRLQHPTSTLVIGLAGFLLFTAIAVISNVFANATTSWKTTTVFVGFALLALPILGDYFAAPRNFGGRLTLRTADRLWRLHALDGIEKCSV